MVWHITYSKKSDLETLISIRESVHSDLIKELREFAATSGLDFESEGGWEIYLKWREVRYHWNDVLVAL